MPSRVSAEVPGRESMAVVDLVERTTSDAVIECGRYRDRPARSRVPIVFPFVTAAGIDPVHFGAFTALMCEISLPSPPVGTTLDVIRGVRTPGR